MYFKDQTNGLDESTDPSFHPECHLLDEAKLDFLLSLFYSVTYTTFSKKNNIPFPYVLYFFTMYKQTCNIIYKEN